MVENAFGRIVGQTLYTGGTALKKGQKTATRPFQSAAEKNFSDVTLSEPIYDKPAVGPMTELRNIKLISLAVGGKSVPTHVFQSRFMNAQRSLRDAIGFAGFNVAGNATQLYIAFNESPTKYTAEEIYKRKVIVRRKVLF
jgi:hypothetical protein